MKGKLIVHGSNGGALSGHKPIAILIDKEKAGSAPEFEKTLIDIEKDCTLTLKYGFNKSKPLNISSGMLTEIQCVFATDRLRAEIIRCVPYEPEKENEEALSEMRAVVAECKAGKMSVPDGADAIIALQDNIVEWTQAVEDELVSLMGELDALCPPDDSEAENNSGKNEHRMRCNVCGRVFCYNDEDISKNLKNAGVGALSALGGLASIFGGGTIFHTHHLQGQADRYTDKIVDFSRCPSCNSTDISEIQGEEAKQSGQSNTVTTSAASSAEEIKKFSELLEMGIITQEEFDAKKKQLLGL